MAVPHQDHKQSVKKTRGAGARKLSLPKFSMRDMRIHVRMTILVLIIAAPLFVIQNYILTSQAIQQIESDTNVQLGLTNATYEAATMDWIKLNEGVLKQLASTDQMISMDPAQQTQLLVKTSQAFPTLFLLHTISPTGMDIARSDGQPLANFAEREWFKATMSGAEVATQVLISKTNNQPSQAMAVPIKDSTGKIVGVLESASNLGALSEELFSISKGHGSDAQIIFVVDQTDHVVAHPNKEIFSKLTDYKDYPPVKALRTGGRSSFQFTDAKGETWLTSMTPLPNGWAVVTQVPTHVAFAQVSFHQWIAILTTLIGTVLLLTLVFLLVRRSTRNITQLTVAAAAFAQGKLDSQVKVEGDDEVGKLGKTFNEMAAQLQQKLTSEQQQRERLESTVQTYLQHMQYVSRGDLAQRIAMNGREHAYLEAADPLVLLGQKLNEMTDSLQGMIRQIRDTAASLNASAAEITAATSQQASGANEQSAAITQTGATVEEVKAIAQQSSQRAGEVTRSSQLTLQVSQAGQTAVNNTIQSMNQIKQRVEGIAVNILALSEQTQQIGEIITTVNDIASQSNMLALNASVEAARAGEHGKGFSVVAQEVRSLSEQSRQATAQIKDILSEIQKATNATVMATEEGAKGVDEGIRMTIEAQQAIQQLSGAIETAAQAATQLAAGGQQQATGIDQVALAMRDINQATIQSLASTRQAEKAAQDLNLLSQRLADMVAQYKV